MENKDIEQFCDKAFADFKKELLDKRAIPIMLMAAEVEPNEKGTPIFQLCAKLVNCEDMVKCLHNAIKNCQKEMIERKFKNNTLN